MDISRISHCYKLVPIEVTPAQLLLDPSNPRIAEDVESDKSFSLKELTTPQVQEYILSVINKEANHIADLIRGIQSSGFITGPSDMIVKAVPHSDKYLVLEGNRRTTALKHLLSRRDSLPAHVLRTFDRIQVKQFIYTPSSEFSEETVVDIILGKIHIDGPLPWGALERAHYIYNCYVRELRPGTQRACRFEYVPACADAVASMFNFKRGDVRRQIEVYRVYQQLKEQRYDVKPDHYTLIDLALSYPRVRDEYFRFEEDAFHFSLTGLERFNKLCIVEEKAINNPRDFRAFRKIVEDGTEYEIACVENNEQSINDIHDRVKSRVNNQAFFKDLEQILHKLKGMLVADYRETKAEAETIEKIKLLVDEKLWPMAKKKLRE